MLSFKINWDVVFTGWDFLKEAVRNPLPKQAKEWDYYEEPGWRRKYILEIDGDSAVFLDFWNFKSWGEIVFYSSKTNRSKLENLRRWGIHWNRR